MTVKDWGLYVYLNVIQKTDDTVDSNQSTPDRVVYEYKWFK